MNKVPVWKGNDLGYGKRGGVLHVGAHVVGVGEKVPGSLGESEMESLRDKKAIVDDYTDKDKSDDAAAKESKRLKDKSKALRTEAPATLKDEKKTTAAALKKANELVADLKPKAADLAGKAEDAEKAAKKATEEAEGAKGDAKVKADANVKELTKAYGLARDAAAEVATQADTAEAEAVKAKAADDAVAEKMDQLK